MVSFTLRPLYPWGNSSPVCFIYLELLISVHIGECLIQLFYINRNYDFHNLYASSNIRTTTSRTMKWMGHVMKMGEMHTKF
jgi:hypothetical protein